MADGEVGARTQSRRGTPKNTHPSSANSPPTRSKYASLPRRRRSSGVEELNPENLDDSNIRQGALVARHSSAQQPVVEEILRMMEPKKLTALFDNLSKYVPQRLLKEVVESQTGLITNAQEFPAFSQDKGAVLLVDVSGFTKLSGAFAELPGGCERFLVLMNDYFNALIGDISAYGGDVMCFAGDAVVVVFRNSSLKKAALNAAMCASKLVKAHSPYETSAGVTLYIHCGISIGTLNFITLGYESMAVSAATGVMLGKPMEELDVAHSQTSKGECAVTERVWSLIKGTDHPFDEVKPLDHGCMLIGSSFSHAVSRVRTSQVRVPLNRKLDNAWMFNACRSIAPFVPPVVLENLVHGSDQWLAELRKPVIVFMTARVANMDSASLSEQTFRRLQAVVALAIRIMCDQWEGFLRQITCDEKGFVLIFAFGMPGFAHADTAARAIAATTSFARKASQVEESCRIGAGITTGNCYCGPIGSTDHRCEYVIAGDKVNLAARFCFKSNFSVWCEEAIVEQVSSQSSAINIAFHDRGQVRVKGKDDDIQVYEPQVVLGGAGAAGHKDILHGIKALPPSRQVLCDEIVEFIAGDSSNASSSSHDTVTRLDANGHAIAHRQQRQQQRQQQQQQQRRPRDGGALPDARTVLLQASNSTGKQFFLHHAHQALRRQYPDVSAAFGKCHSRTDAFEALVPIITSLLPDANPAAITAKTLRQDPFAALPAACTSRHASELRDALELPRRACLDALSSIYAEIIADFHPALVVVLCDVDNIDFASWQALLELRQMDRCICSLIMGSVPVDEISATAPAVLELQGWVDDMDSPDTWVLPMPPLNLEDAMLLILETLAVRYVPEFLAQLLLERSEGNMVYMVEMCRAILGADLLTIKHGRILTTAPTPELMALLPQSMTDMIGAVIESYPFKHQIVLKIASAFGREFPEHMVAGVCADFGLRDSLEVHGILEVLETDKLIAKHGKELWRFQHATHQEVAYGRILLAQRFDFHLSIAKKLQKVFGSAGSGPNAVVLSKHWARAVQLGDTAQLFMADKDLRMAYKQLRQGAEYALDTGDVPTASEMFGLAWLCIQKQSIMAERDPLFEAELLTGYLSALDHQLLTPNRNAKVLEEKERVTARLFDLYEQSNLELTAEYFKLVVSESQRLTAQGDHEAAAIVLVEAMDLVDQDTADELAVRFQLETALLEVLLDQNQLEQVMTVAERAFNMWMQLGGAAAFAEHPRLTTRHPISTVGSLCFLSRLLSANLAAAKEVEEETLTAAESLDASDKAHVLAQLLLVRLLVCGPTLQTEVLMREFDNTVTDAALPANVFEPTRRLLYIALRLSRRRRGQRLLLERRRYVDELLHRLNTESHSVLAVLVAGRCCAESGEAEALEALGTLLAQTPWRQQTDAMLWRMEKTWLQNRGRGGVEEDVGAQFFEDYVECSATYEEQGRVLDSLYCTLTFARGVDALGLAHLWEEAVVALEAVLARLDGKDAIAIEMVEKAARMVSLLRGEPCPYSLQTVCRRENGILRRFSASFEHLMTQSRKHSRYALSPEMRRRDGHVVILSKRRPTSRESRRSALEDERRTLERSRQSAISIKEEMAPRSDDGDDDDGDRDARGADGRGDSGAARTSGGSVTASTDCIDNGDGDGDDDDDDDDDLGEEEMYVYTEDKTAMQTLRAAVEASKQHIEQQQQQQQQLFNSSHEVQL